MSYWCDDARLNREQRRLDAEQKRAEVRMTNNPDVVEVIDADKRAADEILGCLDASVNDHSYDELLLILADHRLAAEQRLREQVERLDVDALWDALKRQACSDPEKATKIVMLDKRAFNEAIADYRKSTEGYKGNQV
jgi:hypothetical protein